MAENIKKTGTALQPWKLSLKQAFKSLRRIDIGALEDEVGVFLPVADLKAALEPANKLFACYKAQRERLARAKITTSVEEMHKSGDLRDASIAFWFLNRKLAECEVLVRLPPGDKALAAFEAYLNQSVPMLLKEVFLGKGSPPKCPRFKVIGVGEDASGTGSHSATLKEAQAARKAAQA